MSLDWVPRTVQLVIRQMWVFAIASGAIRLSPWLCAKLQLNAFMASYGSWVSLVFIVSVASIVVSWAQARNRSARRADFTASRLLYLNQLSPAEKSVMREFSLQGKNTVCLPIAEPTVAGLLANGILVLVGGLCELSTLGLLGSVGIAGDIRVFVREDLIDLPNGRSEADHRFVFGNRPDFMPELERHNRFDTSW